MKYLGIFTEYQWVYPPITDLEMVDQILELNNMTLLDGIMELGTVCEDFILYCSFAGQKFPCFQNKSSQYTWVDSFSHLGACCSFNYHPSFDNVEPIQTPFFSINGGLAIVGTGRPQASDGKSGPIYSEGFEAIIHHPDDYAVQAHSTAFIQLNRETFIDVIPTSSGVEDKVLALPFRQRNCINSKDFDYFEYRQPACMLECLKKKVYEKCACHPYHLPRASSLQMENSTLRDCKVVDAMCFVNNFCKYFWIFFK
jgi:amiloride-sensitive sodium channel